MAIKKSPTQLWKEGKISDDEFWNSSDMIPLSEAIEQGLLNPSPSEDQVVEEIGHAMIVEALDSF
tara:strand:- start:5206 stop:5400 length:195 start_codon:yes stop_codon:yes gene_type:complete